MEIRDYLRVLRKSWVAIVAFTLLGLAVASILSIVATPEYQASSKVFISLQSGGTAADLIQGSNFAQNQVKSFADIVTTPVVLDPVVSSLDLNVDSQELASHVTATSETGTVVVEISVLDESPTKAASITDAIADSFEQRVSEIVPSDSTGVSPVKITVLQKALVPTEPVSPNTKTNLLFGGLIGLIIGLGFAVLRQALDNRVRVESDVMHLTDAPILGGIAFDPRSTSNPLVVQDDPRSPRAESFRALRTNLQFIGGGDSHRSFVITSSVPGEGKTTTTVNLAIITATAGTNVVLIDADLRKPRVAEYMGMEGGAGLTDVLVGRAELDDVLQKWGTHNLYVLPSGRIPPNPSELLGSTAMLKLIDALEKRFDLVLFDSPPLLPVTDAAILATHTGGALVVVAAGKSHKGQLKSSLVALGNVSSKVAGIILTMVPTKGPDAYGYNKYGYGYGYGDEAAQPKSGRSSTKSSSGDTAHSSPLVTTTGGDSKV